MSHSSSDHPEPRHALRPGPLPRFQLILHRGGEDTMRTLRTIMEVTRFGLEEATQKIGQAQNTGQCPLLVTHRERAELLAEIFAARHLTVSVEPV